MKHLRIYGILLCVAAAFSLTSCLDDDDNEEEGLTPEEIQQCFAATRGSYNGSLIYHKTDTAGTVVNDTVPASWAVLTDSTMVFYQVPSEALAEFVTDSVAKASIARQPAKDITCSISYFQTSPIEWLINPSYVSYDSITYKGQTRQVQIGFYVYNYLSAGVYNSSSRDMQLQLVVGGAYVDGQYDSALIRSDVFHNLFFLKQ